MIALTSFGSKGKPVSASTKTLSGRQVNPNELAVLAELTLATERLARAKRTHAELVDRAIDAGHSERAVASAAGLTGPAVHGRKVAKREAAGDA